jgi:hypothetical protein
MIKIPQEFSISYLLTTKLILHQMLPLPSQAYWNTLEDVLTQYVRHSDNKFDYDNQGIAHRKHINANQIRYIGKESNNIEDNLTAYFSQF